MQNGQERRNKGNSENLLSEPGQERVTVNKECLSQMLHQREN